MSKRGFPPSPAAEEDLDQWIWQKKQRLVDMEDLVELERKELIRAGFCDYDYDLLMHWIEELESTYDTLPIWNMTFTLHFEGWNAADQRTNRLFQNAVYATSGDCFPSPPDDIRSILNLYGIRPVYTEISHVRSRPPYFF